MKTQIKNGQTVLFIGDSITDCARRDPANAPLGFGYVKFFHDRLVASEPEKSVRILNRGISGNTILDLRDRWHDDMLTHKPDWLSVKIGINDLHRHLTQKAEGREYLPPSEFERIYREVLTLTVERLPQTRIVLVSPFYLSTDTNPQNHRFRVLQILPEYIAAIESLSQVFKTLFVPLHSIFQDHLARRHPDCFCPEPVHPNPTGHHIIAESIIKTLSGESPNLKP
jgi:lysophospholipase L1-like esterase